MMIKNLVVFTALLSAAAAAPAKKGGGSKGKPKDGFTCSTSKHSGNNALSISQDVLDKAVKAATSSGLESLDGVFKSGFPHSFGGVSGGATGTKLTFPNADPTCNSDDRQLLEFPVFSDGTFFDKDVKRKGQGTPTPARAIFTKGGKTCGVITHVTEADDGRGSGDFALCPPVAK